MIRLLVSIDDTDNLDSIGTGELADQIAMMIRKKGWGVASTVTRHQLFIHDDIPHTSHNSSMCFEATIDEDYMEEFKLFAKRYLEKHHAEGSDPGLCIVNLEAFTEHNELIHFGKMAKENILTKEMAYEFAAAHRIHLSEHGGTGQGIIGALAGCGLRLSGNDGRFRGKRKAVKPIMTVQELLMDHHIEEVLSVCGTKLQEDTKVDTAGSMKTVFLQHRSVLLLQKKEKQEAEVHWELTRKEKLKEY